MGVTRRNTKTIYSILLISILVLPFQNCGDAMHSELGEDLSSSSLSLKTYSELDKNIFKPACFSCHGATATNINFTNYSTLVASSKFAALYDSVNSGQMPSNGSRLPQSQIDAIYAWIQAGAPNDPPPQAPTGFAAMSTSSTSITLNWLDRATNETGYKLERATATGGPFATINQTASNATSYIDSGLTANTTYYYRLSAYNDIGSSPTVSTQGTTQAPPAVLPPNSPSGLLAAAASVSRIDLTWTDNSNNETGFIVQRATSSGGPFTNVVTVGSNIVTYSDMSLQTATTYYYRIVAVGASSNSAPSTTASATTVATFAWVNTNVFVPRCVSCHSGNAPKAGYNMSTFNGVKTLVVSGNATGSAMYQSIANNSMPPGSPLTDSQKNAVRSWINAGALNN